MHKNLSNRIARLEMLEGSQEKKKIMQKLEAYFRNLLTEGKGNEEEEPGRLSELLEQLKRAK